MRNLMRTWVRYSLIFPSSTLHEVSKTSMPEMPHVDPSGSQRVHLFEQDLWIDDDAGTDHGNAVRIQDARRH